MASLLSDRLQPAQLGEQHRQDGPYGPPPMTDRVLDGRFEFAVGHRVTVSYEQRIVAEAIVACRLTPIRPRISPMRTCSVPSGSTKAMAQTNRAVRSAAGTSASWRQQCVVLLVARPRPRPTRRSHPRHLVEHVNGKTRIVGQRRQAGRRDAGSGLEQRIALEGALGLGRLGIGGDVGKSEHLYSGASAATMRRSSASF